MKLKNDHENLVVVVKSLEDKENGLKKRIEEAKPGKEDSKKRTEMEDRINKLKQSMDEKKRALDEFSATDPERFEALSEFLIVVVIGSTRMYH